MKLLGGRMEKEGRSRRGLEFETWKDGRNRRITIARSQQEVKSDEKKVWG